MTSHAIIGRPPVSKIKFMEMCHLGCSAIFIVSPVCIAALNVSVMGEPPVGLAVLLTKIFKSLYIKTGAMRIEYLSALF